MSAKVSARRLGGCERLVEVRDKICDIFDANGQANETVSQATLEAQLPRDGGMGHECRRLDQRLHSTQRFRQGDKPRGRDDVSGGLESSLHLETHHAAEAA